MRDALLAALTLDTFHRHADKVAMANVAQLVNCLHSLFLAHEDRFLATPTFDVFEMYGAHVGAQAVRTAFSAPRIQYQRVGGTGSFWGLSGSASVKDRTLTMTLVNPHVTEPRTVEIGVRGGSPGEAKAVVLSAPDIHAHNTFDEPRKVQVREQRMEQPRSGIVVHELSPASVTRITLELS